MKGIAAVMVLMGLSLTALAGGADDLKAMQGQWSLTIVERDGKPAGDELKTIRLVMLIAGNDYRVLADDKVIGGGTFTLDSRKSPPTIDTRISEGPNKGVVEKGIYKIEGDRMVAVFASPGKARPTAFTTKEGSGQSILHYVRVKQ
jgi:uncharacterized protein (TIGR03067 family)